jgi:hypothetical protein
LLSFWHVYSFTLTTTKPLMFFSLTSSPFSRSPGRGSYGSPPSFKRPPCSSSPSWLVLPTYSFFTSLFFSQCWLINSRLDRCCMRRLHGRQLIGAHHRGMRCKNKLYSSSAAPTGHSAPNPSPLARLYSCSLSIMWRHVCLEGWNDDVVSTARLFYFWWPRPASNLELIKYESGTRPCHDSGDFSPVTYGGGPGSLPG